MERMLSGTTGSYRELEVYRLAHALAVAVHHFSLCLPRFELHESGSQLRRAAKSVAANIVEGFGRRRYKAEFIRFLIFAHASCLETREWLELLHDCHAGLSESVTPLLEQNECLSRKLNRFIQAVETGHRSAK